MTLIKLSPGAKLTNSTITDNVQIGGNAMIDNQGEIEGTEIDRNITMEPIKKSWHERPLGFIVATIFCGLVVAFCAYYFGWTK
jgi:hypothetical protein